MLGRMQELDDLQTVTQPEHVKSNRMAQAARRMRYPVAMCTYSYTLLECFLQAHKLKLPLHTINEHIDLQVMGMSSRPAAGITLSRAYSCLVREHGVPREVSCD